jgi:Fe-S oxidoreductase
MPDPVATVYAALPGFVWLWALTLVAVTLFSRKVSSYIRVLRAARPENRFDQIPQRLRLFAVNVLGQKRLLQEPAIGAAHFLIFWAFVFYALAFFWNLLRGLFPFLPLPYADQVRPIEFALALLGILGLVALAVAAVRRHLIPPPRLEQSRDADIILALIAIVLMSALAGLAYRARAPRFGVAMWWVHMITVLGFLAYLPYSKHLHLLVAPFGVFFGALRKGGMPAASEGATHRDEFTWRQLFSGLACAECGRCDRACPSLNGGSELSPKMLMHHVKELVRSNGRSLAGDVIKPEEIWGCTTCGACMERCPVFNEHIPILVEMRRRLVSEGALPGGLAETLTNLSRYGNSFGVSPRVRAKWTQGLDFRIKDARKEPVEYLWFVGDYASYDQRLPAVTRAMARVLHAAGVDFGILYDGEQNSGNDVRRTGEEGLFEMLAEKNLKTLRAAHFARIVTSDPHSFHALKNEYPDNIARPVVHYSELLAGLISAGKIRLRKPMDLAVTYHDPCYLGRYNGVYGAPRAVLHALGVQCAEMPRNRSSALCCGAGGGRIWMEDTVAHKERPAESRVCEAASLPGVETLVVACPKDLVMFQDAVKTTGLEGRMAVKDLAELVEEAM